MAFSALDLSIHIGFDKEMEINAICASSLFHLESLRQKIEFYMESDTSDKMDFCRCIKWKPYSPLKETKQNLLCLLVMNDRKVAKCKSSGYNGNGRETKRFRLFMMFSSGKAGFYQQRTYRGRQIINSTYLLYTCVLVLTSTTATNIKNNVNSLSATGMQIQ